MEPQFTLEGCQKPLVIVPDEAQLVMDRASRSERTAQLTALLMTSRNAPRHYTEQEC